MSEEKKFFGVGLFMKWIRQFLWVLLFTFVGECLHALLPLSVPAGIYGMVLLFLCLIFGVIKLEAIEGVADFLLEIIPLFFLPAGVGLMNQWLHLEAIWAPVLILVVVVTVLVMVVTGRVAQRLIRKGKKKEGADYE